MTLGEMDHLASPYLTDQSDLLHCTSHSSHFSGHSGFFEKEKASSKGKKKLFEGLFTMWIEGLDDVQSVRGLSGQRVG